MSLGRGSAGLDHPIEALVFDLDGTLLDHVGSVHAGLARWLPSLGVQSTAEFVAAWFVFEEKHFTDWQLGAISFVEQRRRRLRDFLPLVGHTPGDESELDAVFDDYRTAYQAAWTAFDDVVPAIDALAAQQPGRPMAVLTNGGETQQRAKLTALGLDERLNPLYTAEALGVAKPTPASYQEVCRRLDVGPARVLHIGDRHDLDVIAARAAGLQAVHLDRPGEVEVEPSDEPLRIHSLTELPGLLRL